MINVLNSVDISLISHAMSVSMRTDLTAQYSKIIAEVMLYSKDTFDIVVEKEVARTTSPCDKQEEVVKFRLKK
ncbi:hypothetical protein GCM10020331_099040 [Ectobacillus funiculus]